MCDQVEPPRFNFVTLTLQKSLILNGDDKMAFDLDYSMFFFIHFIGWVMRYIYVKGLFVIVRIKTVFCGNTKSWWILIVTVAVLNFQRQFSYIFGCKLIFANGTKQVLLYPNTLFFIQQIVSDHKTFFSIFLLGFDTYRAYH